MGRGVKGRFHIYANVSVSEGIRRSTVGVFVGELRRRKQRPEQIRPMQWRAKVEMVCGVVVEGVLWLFGECRLVVVDVGLRP